MTLVDAPPNASIVIERMRHIGDSLEASGHDVELRVKRVQGLEGFKPDDRIQEEQEPRHA